MPFLKKSLLVLLALAIVLVAVAYLLPRQVHVERAITIAAPPAVVFTLLNGYKRFNEWSPWAALDPNTRYTWEGPDFGVGARLTWAGDPKKVGSGSQEIVESRPFELLRNELDFGDDGLATTQFALYPDGDGTHVVWGFDTDLGRNPLARYVGPLFDGMIGPDYERGLAGLKRLAESLPSADFSDLEIEIVDVEPRTVAYVRKTTSNDLQQIAAAIGAAYGEIGKFVRAHGLSQAGPPMTINHRWDDTSYEFDAAIPIDRAPATPPRADSVVRIEQMHAGRAVRAVAIGPYSGLRAAHAKLEAFRAASGYEAAGPAWDEYVSDPRNTPEAEIRTQIHIPVKKP